MPDKIDEVKVFSATKARDRDALGDRVTRWLEEHRGLEVLSAVVRQSSDAEFHCLSIVLFCAKVAEAKT